MYRIVHHRVLSMGPWQTDSSIAGWQLTASTCTRMSSTRMSSTRYEQIQQTNRSSWRCSQTNSSSHSAIRHDLTHAHNTVMPPLGVIPHRRRAKHVLASLLPGSSAWISLTDALSPWIIP
eukprot:scpid13548/ scgid4621/ 